MHGSRALTEAATFDMELYKSMTYYQNDVAALQNQVGDLQNDARTCAGTRTPQAQSRSLPVRFELVSYRGEVFGPYASIMEASEAAQAKWPGQDQNEDRTGAGWDIQCVGVK